MWLLYSFFLCENGAFYQVIILMSVNLVWAEDLALVLDQKSKLSQSLEWLLEVTKSRALPWGDSEVRGEAAPVAVPGWCCGCAGRVWVHWGHCRGHTALPKAPKGFTASERVANCFFSVAEEQKSLLSLLQVVLSSWELVHVISVTGETLFTSTFSLLKTASSLLITHTCKFRTDIVKSGAKYCSVPPDWYVLKAESA